MNKKFRSSKRPSQLRGCGNSPTCKRNGDSVQKAAAAKRRRTAGGLLEDELCLNPMDILEPNVTGLAGSEVVIVCNERGLWLKTLSGSRIDLVGFSTTEAVRFCKANSLRLTRIQKHFDTNEGR